jgi:hypothetical protein
MPLSLIASARVAFATCVLTAVCVVPANSAVVPGKLRAGKSAAGQFAVTSVTASINKPRGIWVRLTGGVENGTAVVSCSRDFTISANSYDYKRAGTYKVPIRPRAADRCQVVASVGGSGRVRVEIRAN